MSRLRYRFARRDDIGALVRLRLDFFIEGGNDPKSVAKLAPAIRAYFKKFLPSGDFVVALAEREGEIIALCGMVLDHHPPRPGHPTGLSPYILNVYVLPKFRGQGIASRLMAMLVAKAKKSGAKSVSLHHWPGKSGFYEKLGFTLREREMSLSL